MLSLYEVSPLIGTNDDVAITILPGQRDILVLRHAHRNHDHRWIRAQSDLGRPRLSVPRPQELRLRALHLGSTRSKLTQKQLMQAEIPLPPLEDQRRIAAILDHADALRAKRRQVLAHLDTLTQSIFHDMFGDPVIQPMQHLVISREFLVGPSPAERAAIFRGYPYLRVEDQRGHHGSVSEVRHSEDSRRDPTDSLVRGRSACFVRPAPIHQSVGRVATIDGRRL